MSLLHWECLRVFLSREERARADLVYGFRPGEVPPAAPERTEGGAGAEDALTVRRRMGTCWRVQQGEVATRKEMG